MPSLFAHFINEQLQNDGFQPLHKLKDQKSLVDAYQADVTDKLFFDPFGNRPDFHYAMTCLYVYEYFDLGPNFTMPDAFAKIKSKEALAKWQSKTQIPANASEDSLVEAIKFVSHAVTSVYHPTGQADAVLGQYASALTAASVLLEQIPGYSQCPAAISLVAKVKKDKHHSIFDKVDIKEWQSLPWRLWDQWNNNLDSQSPDSFWKAGILNAKKTSRESVNLHNGDAIYFLHWGEDLKAWVEDHKEKDFVSKNPNSENIVFERLDPGPPIGACFTAGTSVICKNGPRPIEQLIEGDEILTRGGDTHQWGIRSSETVQHPAPEFLYGFNDDEAFFTSGHVFHTTTGLRAVEPSIAIKENPWLDVGRLQVGHHLLQLDEAGKYKPVLIVELKRAKHTSEFVYGVHLREGLRSYHANGYLVAVNYPEITVSSVAQQLSQIPAKQRLTMLSTLAEIAPLLDRFGGATLLAALDRETKKSSILYGGKPRTEQVFRIHDIHMPYVVRGRDSKRSIMEVELHHGVLLINGKHCERVRINRHILSFSHFIADGFWIHGHFEFNQFGKHPTGWLLRSKETEFSDRIDLKQATPVHLIPGTIISTASKPSPTFLSRNNRPVPHLLFDGNSDDDDGDDIQGVKFALKYSVSTYVPGTTPSPDTALVSCATAAVKVVEGAVNWSSMSIEEYDRILSAVISQSKKEQPDVAKLDLSNMSSLYSHRISYDISQREQHEFILDHPQVIIQASDNYAEWKKLDHYMDLEPPIEDLTFKNIGLGDIKLPLLMKRITFGLRAAGHRLEGIIRRFETYTDGQEGLAHWTTGSVISQPSTPLPIAMHMATASALKNSRSLFAIHAEPSDIAVALSAAGAEDSTTVVEDIIKVPLIQVSINRRAQQMFTNIMQWHMDHDERKNFFGSADKPSGLPSEFTDQLLNSPTAKWLKDTYARAYICQILTLQEGLLNSQFRFTAQEKRNIRYFWNGKGKNCLSREPIYKNLDRAINRHLIRTINVSNDSTKAKFPIKELFDSGAEKAQKFSDDIFDMYSKDKLGLSQACALDPATGSTLMTKLCAIMDALDAGHQRLRSRLYNQKDKPELRKEIKINDTNSNQLVYKVQAYQKGASWKAPWWGILNTDGTRAAETTLEEAWLKDCLQDMVTAILERDPSVQDDVTKEIKKLIEEAGKNEQGWADMKAKRKAELVTSGIVPKLKRFMDAMGILLGWVKQGGKWVIDAGKRLVFGWAKGVQRIGDAAEQIVNEGGLKGFVKGPLAKGLFCLLGVAAVGVAAWNLSDRWSDASAADRGLMISGLIGAIGQLSGLGVDFALTCFRFKGGIYSEATETALKAGFDNLMTDWMSEDWAVLEPGADGFSTPKNLFKSEVQLEEELLNNPVTWLEGEERVSFFEVAQKRMGQWIKFKRGFNIASRVVQYIGYIAAIGVAIFMTWQLIQDWDKLDTAHKIFQTLQTVFALIEGIGAAIIVGATVAGWTATALVSLGVLGAGGTAFAASAAAFVAVATTVFAAVALALAVCAIVVLVVMLIYDSKQPPPPNWLELWNQNTGKPWAAGFKAPDPAVAILMSPDSFTSSKDEINAQSITITIMNPKSEAVSIDGIEVAFSSGPDPSAVFYKQLEYHDAKDDISTNQAGQVLMTSSRSDTVATMDIANFKGELNKETNKTKVFINGKKREDSTTKKSVEDLKLNPLEVITLKLFGAVYDEKGQDCSVSITLKDPVFSDEDPRLVHRSKGAAGH